MALAVNNRRGCHKGAPAKVDSAEQVPPPRKKKRALLLCDVP